MNAHLKIGKSGDFEIDAGIFRVDKNNQPNNAGILRVDKKIIWSHSKQNLYEYKLFRTQKLVKGKTNVNIIKNYFILIWRTYECD